MNLALGVSEDNTVHRQHMIVKINGGGRDFKYGKGVDELTIGVDDYTKTLNYVVRRRALRQKLGKKWTR